MDTYFVSIKLHDQQRQLPSQLAPFVYGSSPLLGSWDPDKAIKMRQASELLWEVELAIPPPHGELEFSFLVKHLDNPSLYGVEDHPKRLLLPANRAYHSTTCAKFKDIEQIKELELSVSMQMESISPALLAAMWRAYEGDSKCKQVETNAIDDVEFPVSPPKLSHPSTLNGNNQALGLVAPKTKTLETVEEKDKNLQDLVVLGSESEKVQGVYSESDGDAKPVFCDIFPNSLDTKERPLDNKEPVNRVYVDDSFQDEREPGTLVTQGTMPKVSSLTFLVADQLLVPKERRRLAIIMVGLPARGKSFTATKLTRYLRWLGHKTKHFNVGQYRRLKHGYNQKADFFRADNQGGLDARNEIAALAMDDMLMWMQEGGQIGIFDATNSTTERRRMLLQRSEGKCKVIFLEIICNDRLVIERNIQLKIQQSPDYKDMPDFEESLNDFKARLTNYEKAYEPVAEGSYIKMIDTVGGEGGQVQINNISGYLPGRILFFLVNTHTSPRPIFLTRPGESFGTIQKVVGGDHRLSERGEEYAKVLADFVNEQLKTEHTASVWTSTLQRTLFTAQHLHRFPKVQWRALDDISAGICDGMTYDEIKNKMAEEYKARSSDKLRYRYPRGESYLDVIQRLEPVIIELERQHAPVIIVAHQAVLRSLYGYFADKPIEQIPYIEIPLHTVIEIQMGMAGVEEKRFKLLE
ncbi:hypothetical protein KP509_14G031600 [Ceratopteris richardii]|uniref:CBM20 domain-containing protein n=1 Tax=Ceratopteris richardii TaxID=49495 RepID=A0A8T2TAN9_CERRI|nr:hypothetical protein KP509_14G031600 [Ceratopteris richardii]